MMMSLLERRAEKAVLADDFAEWIAGWKDTWKVSPHSVHFALLIRLTILYSPRE